MAHDLLHLPEQRAQLAGICRACQARQLHLFGSGTRDDFDPGHSDLDFLVDFESGLSPAEYSQAFFKLKAALEDLFGRPVDLITQDALRNPYFRQRVEAEQVPLYVA